MSRFGSLLPADVVTLSAGAGTLAWLALVAAGELAGVTRWLAFAVLVLVPLGMPQTFARTRAGRRPRTVWLVAYLQPLGAALVVGSLLVDQGEVAGALAAGWLVVAALLALSVLGRLLERGATPLAETLVDLGGVYLVVGAGWLVLSRLNAQPLAFAPHVVELTAVHFHYAGFVLPVVAGVVGRLLDGPRTTRAYVPTAVVVALGPPLVAVGITVKQVWGEPRLEAVFAVLLAGGVAALAALVLVLAVRGVRRHGRRGTPLLLAVAAVAVVGTMGLAAWYALGQAGWATGAPTVSEMVARHGTLNALAFGFCGLLAATALGTRPAWRRGVPLDGPRAGRHVGADFFDRRGLDGEDASGVLPDATVLERPTFEPDRLHPAVRALVEETSSHAGHYRTDWHDGARLLGRLLAGVARWADQAPVQGPTEEGFRRVAGEGTALDDDGTAWTWTDPETGALALVARVWTHDYADVRYLDLSLPTPWSTLTVVSRPEAVPLDGGLVGLRLDTRGRGRGDEGVYLETRLGALALPVSVTTTVWPADDSTAPSDLSGWDGDLVAHHRVRLFGRGLCTVSAEWVREDE
jgi:hypothetical protein